MHPTDPAHVSAMVTALRAELGPDAAVSPSARVPASGGAAVQVRAHGVTLWLHATRTATVVTRFGDLGGQLRYTVRDADGRDLGGGYPGPGESDLVAAAFRVATRCQDPLAQQIARERAARVPVAA